MTDILLDVDPISGATETFSFDENTQTAVIKHRCDVSPVLDWNKEQQNHGYHGRAPGEDDLDLRLVARIPNIVAHKWLREHGVNVLKKEHWPYVKRLLNSNEYRYLRVSNIIL